MSVARAPRAPHSALLLVFAVACAGENTAKVPLDGRERLPGGDTTNTLLLGSDAFKRPAENATAANAPVVSLQASPQSIPTQSTFPYVALR